MKFILALTVALAATVCSEELYTSENDDLDIEGVINDPVQLKAFVDCFTDKGECKPPLPDLKNDLPEAIQQSCARCTDAQKHILKRFLEGLQEKMPAGYQAMKDKYDPNNKYFAPLAAAIAKS